MRGLSPVAASGGHSSSRCAGLSLSWPLLLRSISSRCTGSVVVAHRPSCSTACGIFPDQGSNPCPLHWQADSQPLRHQGSPCPQFYSWQRGVQILHSSCRYFTINHFAVFPVVLIISEHLFVLCCIIIESFGFVCIFSGGLRVLVFE